MNKQTTMLMVGDGFNGNSIEEFHTGKAAKAVHWQAKNHTIEVLTEGDFFEMLEGTECSGTRAGRRADVDTAASVADLLLISKG